MDGLCDVDGDCDKEEVIDTGECACGRLGSSGFDEGDAIATRYC